MKYSIIMLLSLIIGEAVYAQNPWMVKQINQNSSAAPSNTIAPTTMYELNANTVVFFANDNIHGTELWKSNGTTNGTTFLYDVVPGAQSPAIGYIYQADNILYFWQADYSFQPVRYTIWRTDGTPSGTFKIFSDSTNRHTSPFLGSSGIFNVASIGSSLYFLVYEPIGSIGYNNIYRTDGATGNTTLYLQTRGQIGAIGASDNKVYVNASFYYSGAPQTIVDIGMEVYAFSPNTLPAGWANYNAALDFSPGTASTVISEFVNVNDNYILFYGSVTQNNTTSMKLMKMSSTDIAPVIIGNIPQNGFYTSFNSPNAQNGDWNESWAIGNKYFFKNGYTSPNAQITVTDGTSAGTFNIQPPSGYNFQSIVGRVNNKIILSSASYYGKNAEWDGVTPTSYSIIADSLNYSNTGAGILRVVKTGNRLLYFGGSGYDIWQSDTDGVNNQVRLLKLNTGFMGGVTLGNSYFGWGDAAPFHYTETGYQPIKISTDYKLWTGVTSTDWNTAGNWLPVGIPLSTDDVYIPNVPNAPMVNNNNTCRNLYINELSSLTVNASKTLTVNGDMSVCGGVVTGNGSITRTGLFSNKTYGNGTTSIDQININGSDIEYNVETGNYSSSNQTNNNLNVNTIFNFQTNNKLILNTTSLHLLKYPFASGSGSHSFFMTNKTGKLFYYISNSVPITSITIPVGHDTDYCTPVTLSNSGLAGSSIMVNITDTLYAGGTSGSTITSNAIHSVWNINYSTIYPTTLTLSWDPADTFAGFDRNNCFIAHWHNNNWDLGTPQAATFSNNLYAVTQTGYTSFSPFIVITGNTPQINITASSNPICSAANDTFTAYISGVNGNNAHYQWKKNGNNVGTDNHVYVDNLLNNNDTITCILSSTELFANPQQSLSNPLFVTVLPPNLPQVSISSGAGNNVCAGTSVSFTATSLYGGTAPNYQWKRNGNNVGINSPTYTYIPANGDTITCVLTTTSTCAPSNTSVSNSIVMTVNPLLMPSITVAASQNNICTGTNVNFTATTVNGGSSPSYQWMVNGNNMGTNSNVYSYTPASGDAVTCELTSNAQCASPVKDTSAPVTMTVNPMLIPSITVAASQNNICVGTGITFTATLTNGGAAPSYQWMVNSNVAGTNNATYSYTPANGDVVTCELTSNAPCANPAKDTSVPVVINVSPTVTPSLNITAVPGTLVNSGAPVTFTAAPTNGGVNPQYEWRVNGTPVTGINTSAWTATAGTDFISGDVVTAFLTSDEDCVHPDTAVSNALTMQITVTGIYDPINKNKRFEIYPNPASSAITVATTFPGKELVIYDVTGRKLLGRVLPNEKNKIDISVFSPGVYLYKYDGEWGKVVKE